MIILVFHRLESIVAKALHFRIIKTQEMFGKGLRGEKYDRGKLDVLQKDLELLQTIYWKKKRDYDVKLVWIFMSIAVKWSCQPFT